MSYTLPPLPYPFDALEPYIDAKTMEIHYTKHHQAYVDNLNKALSEYPALQDQPLSDILKTLDALPAKIRTAVRNNGGGHYNHSFFWPLMKKNGGGEPKGKSAQAINQFFGSLSEFQDHFNAAAKGVFGSGWAWLCIEKNGGKLIISSTPNQDTPLPHHLAPILGLDVWEHAYYLKYQNRRPDYISAWWHVVNWNQVEENYRAIVE